MASLTPTICWHVANPYLLTTKIQLDEDETTRQRMIACIDQQLSRSPNYHGGYTFEVKDPCNDFAKIYNTFFSIVSNIFGSFNLSTKQRNYCWANVYNKDTYRSNLHHHLQTSSVNGIFYLNTRDFKHMLKSNCLSLYFKFSTSPVSNIILL